MVGMDAQNYANSIVKKLTDEGFIAYFAGGWVRDFLMGHPSSDIDIATNAPPEKIIELFSKTIKVGISFGVVVVVLDGHQFEVSTFRQDLEYHDGRRPSDVKFSTPEEDAQRRDFTINGLFYDPVEDKIIDFVNGQKDIQKRVVRTIGNPQDRFEEDRLRMIRAVRFAYRFAFHIDEETHKAIRDNARTLFPAVAIERVWQELKKMSTTPTFSDALVEMHRLGLLQVIFPILEDVSESEIEKRLSSLTNFPEESPEVLQVMELFPDLVLERQLELCLYLKVSNKNQKLVEYTHCIRDREQKGSEEVEWSRLYAHPHSHLCLEVVAARLSEEERVSFLKKHKMKQESLSTHIKRIQLNTPLITAADLQKEGIAPSKKMGDLLLEAERIAVNQNLNDKQAVLVELKKTPLWER